jgi:hypothetical protein
LKALSRHLPGGTEENNESSVRRVGVSAEIRTGYFPDTGQKHCRLFQLDAKIWIAKLCTFVVPASSTTQIDGFEEK